MCDPGHPENVTKNMRRKSVTSLCELVFCAPNVCVGVLGGWDGAGGQVAFAFIHC